VWPAARAGPGVLLVVRDVSQGCVCDVRRGDRCPGVAFLRQLRRLTRRVSAALGDGAPHAPFRPLSPGQVERTVRRRLVRSAPLLTRPPHGAIKPDTSGHCWPRRITESVRFVPGRPCRTPPNPSREAVVRSRPLVGQSHGHTRSVPRVASVDLVSACSSPTCRSRRRAHDQSGSS
jgi:hypothetical protein